MHGTYYFKLNWLLLKVGVHRRLLRCLHYPLTMSFYLDMSVIKGGSGYSSVTLTQFNEVSYRDTSGSQHALVMYRRILAYIYLLFMGRDSSVCIATRYGLDGLGIESRWERDFPHPSRPALRPIQPPVLWILGLFPGGKSTGAWP
jgi:hypothetical protein